MKGTPADWIICQQARAAPLLIIDLIANDAVFNRSVQIQHEQARIEIRAGPAGLSPPAVGTVCAEIAPVLARIDRP
jgi:hypothetical protein